MDSAAHCEFKYAASLGIFARMGNLARDGTAKLDIKTLPLLTNLSTTAPASPSTTGVASRSALTRHFLCLGDARRERGKDESRHEGDASDELSHRTKAASVSAIWAAVSLGQPTNQLVEARHDARTR